MTRSTSPQQAEQEWLSLASGILSIVLLAYLPWRLRQLRRASVKAKKHWLARLENCSFCLQP